MTKIGLIAAVVAGIAAQPAEPPQSENSITVYHRFASILCAGVCLDSDLTVRADGVVDYRVRSAFRGPWKAFRYRISPEQVRAFWNAYAKIRPNGLKGPIGTCDQRTLIIDNDIWWKDATGQSRLLACYGVEEVRKTYWTGFRILRFSPVTGQKLTAKQAETLR